MFKTTLIRGAQVVRQGQIQIADIRIRGSIIDAIAPTLPSEADEIIEARGLTVLPGVIDPQVHFRDPGLTYKEDLESGSKAAAAGGVTSFLEMPNTTPNTITAELMAEKKLTAAKKCVVNWNFFIGATVDNLEELDRVPNVCGIKIFMGASTGSLLVHRDEDLERIFAHGRRLIAVHAEDEDMIQANKKAVGITTSVHDHNRIRTVEAALKATQRAAKLSRKYNRRLHILHVTTAEEAEYLAVEKQYAPISAEVCPQHFLLHTPEVYDRLGTYGQMNPPIREARHGAGLWKALKQGTFDCLATDHAPHTREEKDKGYPQSPSGMPGVETLLPLMLHQVNQGLCSLTDLTQWMCEGPARCYGLKGKGKIEPGYDADLVLVDMAKTRTIENGKLFCKVNWSPYNGWSTQGWPIMTLVLGQPVFREGEIIPGVLGRELIIDAPWERS